MAGKGMGAATAGGGCVEKGPRNKMVKDTSKTTGPVFLADGGDVSPRKRMAMGMKDGGSPVKKAFGGLMTKKVGEAAQQVAKTAPVSAPARQGGWFMRAAQQVAKTAPVSAPARQGSGFMRAAQQAVKGMLATAPRQDSGLLRKAVTKAAVATKKGMGMKKGGDVKEGYHMMPDGSMMKGKKHPKKMKKGGSC
jgi:hypothetical protein